MKTHKFYSATFALLLGICGHFAFAQCVCDDIFNATFPAVVDGVNVTTSSTGSVTVYAFDWDNSCGATVGVDPNAIYIGQMGPFTYTFLFDQPVITATLVINASDHAGMTYNESFTFSANAGTLSLSQDCGCYDITGLTAGCILDCSDAGGKLIVNSDLPFTELTVTGPGNGNGSLMGLCGLEVVDGCTIDVSLLDTICDDNGTPTDPSDDLFYVELEVTGTGNGINWELDDIHSSSGVYDLPTVIGPYEIVNGDLNLIFVDQDTDTCDFQLLFEAPPTCSDSCVNSIEIIDYFCDDNNTPVDSTDDVYYVEIVVSNINGSMSWIADDISNSTGNYGDAVLIGPYEISNGLATVIISDALSALCSENIDLIPPPACSDSCILIFEYLDINCANNGTPATSDDDVFFIEFLLSSLNTNDSWISDDSLAVSGMYDLPIISGPYHIASGDITIIFEDADNAICPLSVTFEAPNVCSECDFDASLSPMHENCQDSDDGAILVDQINGGSPPFNVIVNNESLGEITEINGLADGLYAVQLVDGLGCVYEETLEILAGPLVQIDINPVDVLIEGDSVQLSLTINNAALNDIDSIVWQPSEIFSCTNCPNPYVTLDESQQISVWLTTAAGCEAEATLFLNAIAPEIYVPNIFTPNGDGLNDEFRVFSAPNRIREVQISVFGRWGNLVFQGAGDPEKVRWDGTHKGELKNSNVFVYSIDLELQSGRLIKMSGDITLLR